MKRLTTKGIERYITNNYGRLRHNCEAMRIACVRVSNIYKCSPVDVFHFIIENEPINNLYTHSYGFHTGLGRQIVEDFKVKYYEGVS